MLVEQLNVNLKEQGHHGVHPDDGVQLAAGATRLTDRSYGARPLRRAIQRHIEDALSEAFIRGQVRPQQADRDRRPGGRAVVLAGRPRREPLRLNPHAEPQRGRHGGTETRSDGLPVPFSVLRALRGLRRRLWQRRPTAVAQALEPSDLVEKVDLQGNQFLQKETLLFYVSTKPGERFDERAPQGRLPAPVGHGLPGRHAGGRAATRPAGKVVVFTVKERKRVQIVDYRGTKALTTTQHRGRAEEARGPDPHRQLLRPRQGAAGGGHHQADAGRQGPSLRHGEARRQVAGRGRLAGLLHRRRGPQGQGQGDRLRRQRGLLGRRPARAP